MQSIAQTVGENFLRIFVLFSDKIHQRQLKESHQSDVPVSPVDSVCSQITQIGQLNNQVRPKTPVFSVAV